MAPRKLEDILFYVLDKSIRTYRQFAQRRLGEAGYDITVDQWLILKAIEENEGIPQQEIAEIAFKDAASVTRIIELLVKKGYLSRDAHPEDRRRVSLKITRSGKSMLQDVQKVINQNRAHALKGISPEQREQLKTALQQIISNCQ